MKQKHLHFIALSLIILIMALQAQTMLHTKYYQKCKLFTKHKGKHISQLKEEIVPIYKTNFYIEPLIKTKKQLEYKGINYFYHEYIGAGGSGQVYLVEQLQTNKPKVLKRFFRERMDQFEEENFVMHRLNYSVNWMRDNFNGLPSAKHQSDESQFQEHPRNDHTSLPTIAIYPSKQSLVLRDVEFFPRQGAMIFYKILLELERVHKQSLIHNDMKMGNIMINSLGYDFKIFEVQIIDWNLVTFYYLGVQGNSRKGTVCYYSPEQLMRTLYTTPAIDIWALGVVMWTFFTDDKPFFSDCKENNIKAIATMAGIQQIINLQKKYGLSISSDYNSLLKQHARHPSRFQAKELRQLVPQGKQDIFTDELIDVFTRIFTVDPQYRITASQLLLHPYFIKMKRIPPMYEQKNRVKEQKRKRQQRHRKQQQQQMALQQQKQHNKNQAHGH